MKHLYLLFRHLSLALLVSWCHLFEASAQAPAASSPTGLPTCYQASGTQTGGTTPTSPTFTQYNPYGDKITARGELRVLIVYAGFTNDIVLGAPNYAENDEGTNPWPQTDATHPVPGTSFPKNAGRDIYTTAAQFSTSATDQSLSNFYYQMSQFSDKPFKLVATVFPKRFNVTADDATNLGAGFHAYTDQVIAALRNDPATAQFDFSPLDQRTTNPAFQRDNSIITPTSPDGIIDYVIVVWRNPGTPYRLTKEVGYGSGGWAHVRWSS